MPNDYLAFSGFPLLPGAITIAPCALGRLDPHPLQMNLFLSQSSFYERLLLKFCLHENAVGFCQQIEHRRRQVRTAGVVSRIFRVTQVQERGYKKGNPQAAGSVHGANDRPRIGKGGCVNHIESPAVSFGVVPHP